MSKNRGHGGFQRPRQVTLPPSRDIANAFQNAVNLHQRGQLAQAELLYRAILKQAPKHFDALHFLGVIGYQQKHYEAARELIRRALKLNPKSAAAHSNLGIVLCELKRHGDALASFDRALAIEPNSAEALNNRGNALRELKRHAEALASYDRALAINPDYAEALNNRGNALGDLQRHDEAVTSYDRALAIKPDYAEALGNQAEALRRLGRHEAALASYDRALAIMPDHAEALNGRGNVLLDLRREDEAVASYDRALAIKPDHAEALNNRAIALFRRKRHAEALASYDRALAIKPDFAEALYNRGKGLFDLERHVEALASYDRALAIKPDYAEALNIRGIALRYLRRHEEALASYDQALAIKPELAEALNNRGNVLSDLKRYEEALVSFDRALAIKPDDAETLSNRGNALFNLKRYEEAAADFERLLRAIPDYDYARGNLLLSRLYACDWSDYDQSVRLIADAVAAGKRAAHPFVFLSVSESAAGQLQCAKILNKDKYPASEHVIWRGERYGHDKIRIAYLSADFHGHATAFLMAGLFEAHDRARFETTAISFGPDSKDALRARLENAFDRFIDVRGKSDRDVALLLKALEIDIAVDLKGYTQDSRTGIFAFRPAPVQVNYLGYPGTMGADYIDYILADRVVIPEDQRAFYAEKVVYLPDAYQPNDSKRRISEHAPTRLEAGLPATGFVFCSFNNSYKITPPVFDLWMRLLGQVEGSVLWLLEDNAAAARNLRKEAAARGIAAGRLIFAPRAKLEDHLARHRLADIFLDTRPINAHTTASDALWAGLPIVTCLGASFAGRVAGSLLQAVGLPELVAENLADYEALALKLARDEHALAAVKAKLARNRQAFPPFDTDRFCRHLERAYETMRERCQRGEPPASFAVTPS